MGGKSPLTRFGVDIEAVDHDGKTALHRATMFSDTDKVPPVQELLTSQPQAMHIRPKAGSDHLASPSTSDENLRSASSLGRNLTTSGPSTSISAGCVAAGQRPGSGGTR